MGKLSHGSDNSDAVWMGDFVEDSGKEQSDRNIGDRSAATTSQSRQGKTKDPSHSMDFSIRPYPLNIINKHVLFHYQVTT
jgi:hypothetical protein